MLKEADAIWVAGYLDGHSSLAYAYCTTGNPRCALCVSTAEPFDNKELVRLLGEPNQRRPKMDRILMYSGARLIEVLTLVIPHLRSKREHALLAYTYATQIITRRNGERTPLTPVIAAIPTYGTALNQPNKIRAVYTRAAEMREAISYSECLKYCEEQFAKAVAPPAGVLSAIVA